MLGFLKVTLVSLVVQKGESCRKQKISLWELHATHILPVFKALQQSLCPDQMLMINDAVNQYWI
jgi:hypothetical protein